jgi:hypothetical protein
MFFGDKAFLSCFFPANVSAHRKKLRRACAKGSGGGGGEGGDGGKTLLQIAKCFESPLSGGGD